ncbi:MAG: galactose mutarotase [Rhodospirillales bacterium]|nr:galactose mutarotase [Rhodospirillales bacterium]
MESAPFGRLADGRVVTAHRLVHATGMTVTFLDFGGTITAIEVPDRDGRRANVTLGFASLAEYEASTAHFGALIGRYANRIAGARFTLDGREYRLPANRGANLLHGGDDGFDRRFWRVMPDADGAGAVLHLESPDGDCGFPGRLAVAVRYRWDEDGAFRLEYTASTDAPTVLSLTNHAYFNLAGEGAGSVEDHLVEIAASQYTPTDAALLPTGEIAPVIGTPLDFRHAVPIGARLRAGHPALRRARGYDHNFVLDGAAGTLRPAARIHEPRTGRVLTVETTCPAMQFYTGNGLDGSAMGPSGRCYRSGDAFCVETQNFPDAPNQPDFPSAVLRPGQVWRETTLWRFGVDH